MGKSTLLLQALGAHGRARRTLPARHAPRSRAAQVRLRAERLGALAPDLLVVAETSLPARRRARRTVRPDVLAVDSIQTVARSRRCPARPDRSRQVRDVRAPARRSWPKDREHRRRCSSATSRRTARSPGRGCSSTSSTPCCRSRATATTRCGCCARSKHRFGSTDELGLFEMTDDGPASTCPTRRALFLADRRAGVAGLGRRCRCSKARARCCVEVQALVATTPAPMPPPRRRRASTGGRLAMLLAVLEQRARRPLADARRLRERRRRGAGRPSPAPTSRSRWRSRARRDDGRSPPTSSRSARSGSAARCARSPQTARRLAEARAARLHARDRAHRRRPDVPGSASSASPTSACVAEADRRVAATAQPTHRGRASRTPSGTQLDSVTCATGRQAPAPDRHRPDRKLLSPCGSSRRARRCARASTASSRRKMGALIVVGDGPEVLEHLLGRVPARRRVHARSGCPSWRRWTARSSSPPTASRIARANVHLVPDPNIPTSETGTRHRTAERVARQIDVPVITVSEEMRVVAVHRRRR